MLMSISSNDFKGAHFQEATTLVREQRQEFLRRIPMYVSRKRVRRADVLLANARQHWIDIKLWVLQILDAHLTQREAEELKSDGEMVDCINATLHRV